MTDTGTALAHIVARNVRAAKGAANVSDAELAASLGMTTRTLKTRLSGAQEFSLAELDRAASRLGYTREGLLSADFIGWHPSSVAA